MSDLHYKYLRPGQILEKYINEDNVKFVEKNVPFSREYALTDVSIK